MFKRFIKNIIPFALLLHISSCSSFGVNKSEMKGACEIIDETLSYSGDNDFKNIKNSGKFSSILKGQKTKILDEKNVNTILNDQKNQTCLKNLKDNIANWGKNDFTKALADCLFLKDSSYTLQYGKNFTIDKEEHIYTDDYSKINKENLFNNLAIIKDPNYYYNINNETNFKSVQGANLACARLIAVDLNQETNQLSYRIKYLPYIFRSGYNSNKNKIKLPNNDTATNLFKSLRFIDDYGGVYYKNGFESVFYGFQEETKNKHYDNSYHTDSERVLFLCLAADGNKIKLDPAHIIVEPIDKLKSFVTDKTIDLCIQICNTYAMCGNCQCFYAGIDKVDLIYKKFALRKKEDTLYDIPDNNIVDILNKMEEGKVTKNDYTNSLILATSKKKSNATFGTKIFMGNKKSLDACDSDKDRDCYKNIKIYYDNESKSQYSVAKKTYYEPEMYEKKPYDETNQPVKRNVSKRCTKETYTNKKKHYQRGSKNHN